MKLLHALEAEECVWNHGLATYHNRDLRDAAKRRIVAALDIPDLTEREAQLKINSVRSAYGLELARLRREEPRSGAGTDEQPVSTLPWFNAASFLRRVVKPRSSTSNLAVSSSGPWW